MTVSVSYFPGSARFPVRRPVPRERRPNCKDRQMNDLTPIEMDELRRLEEHAAPVRRRPGKIGWLLTLAVSIALAWYIFAGESAPAATPPPVVTVATPLQREISEWDEYIGRFEASRSV